MEYQFSTCFLREVLFTSATTLHGLNKPVWLLNPLVANIAIRVRMNQVARTGLRLEQVEKVTNQDSPNLSGAN